eukprot:GHVH01000635.1.p2 GENE.GHVH01000635.1~~GHVH01000635.1.p2  ORF type:complete len:150 (+),score=15.53 GHVH01000635.1:205-654(+)
MCLRLLSLADSILSPYRTASSFSVPLFDLMKAIQYPLNYRKYLYLHGTTELVGPAGSGKTQMALTIVAHHMIQQVVCDQPIGTVHWFDLEGTFTGKRLAEICGGIIKEFHPTLKYDIVVNRLLSSVLVYQLATQGLQVDEQLYSHFRHQ